MGRVDGETLQPEETMGNNITDVTLPTPSAQPISDPFLQEVVDVCNLAGLRVGITLSVGGTIITGQLVGVRDYLREYAKQWAAALPAPEGEEHFYAEKWTKAADEYERQLQERNEKIDRGEDVEPLPDPRFIHLADAKYVTGETITPASGGMLWRGRLSEIDGYSMGVFGPPR